MAFWYVIARSEATWRSLCMAFFGSLKAGGIPAFLYMEFL